MAYNNGHRVLEYGVCMKNGEPIVWRFVSKSDIPSSNILEPEVKAIVSRKGDVTRYEITFPWKTLSLKSKPAKGGSIGFSIAVNDSDADQVGRHGLRLFNGIIERKEPKDYGMLFLRE
jgi:hypothetical protein